MYRQVSNVLVVTTCALFEKRVCPEIGCTQRIRVCYRLAHPLPHTAKSVKSQSKVTLAPNSGPSPVFNHPPPFTTVGERFGVGAGLDGNRGAGGEAGHPAAAAGRLRSGRGGNLQAQGRREVFLDTFFLS